MSIDKGALKFKCPILWVQFKKHMLAVSKLSRHCFGVAFKLRPRASRQSAAPHLEEAARLPCLATLMPALAITNEAVVEILNVLEWSPPVPTISKTSSLG